MTDLQQIKAGYAAMSSGQLQELLLQPETLRRDAFLALKAECKKRGIDPGIIQKADEAVAENKVSRIRDNIKKEDRKWWSAIIAYAFEQRYNDETDDTILAGIMGMGASVGEGLYVVEHLEKLARAQLKDAETDKLAGIIKLVCGLAVIIISFLAGLGNYPVILGGILAAAGLVQFMNGGYRQSRFTTIIANSEGKGMTGFEPFDPDDDSIVFEEIT